MNEGVTFLWPHPQVDEDLTLLDPEENSAYYLDILVESLQKLGHTEHSVNVSNIGALWCSVLDWQPILYTS